MRDSKKVGGPVRGHIRASGFRRVCHGTFLPLDDEADPFDELLRDLEAWLLVLPPGAAFTHLTAAVLRGWQLPPGLPRQVPVFAAVGQGDPRPRRPGLICSRLVRLSGQVQAHGLPVEPAEEVLLRAARDVGALDLLVLVDSARNLGHVDGDAMSRLLATSRPGVRALRRAWADSSHQAESGGETLLRAFDQVMRVCVRPQERLVDAEGRVVAVVDLLVAGTRLVHEYDGAHHRTASQQRIDLRRDRALDRAGYRRRAFTFDDLVGRAAVTMHEIDRDLERPHRLERLRRWRRLVEDSLLSGSGRQRLVNRWARPMGDAARTRSA